MQSACHGSLLDARFDADRDWRMAAQGIGNNAYLKGAERLDLQTPDARGRTFASYLSEAVKVARELWLRLTRPYGGRRREVERAPIVFDFHHAAEVVERSPVKAGTVRRRCSPLVTSSAARLIGRTTCLSSAVTGGDWTAGSASGWKSRPGLHGGDSRNMSERSCDGF